MREGSDGTIITYGNMVGKSLEVQKKLVQNGLNYGVLCFSTLAPQELLDFDAVRKAAGTGRIITYEDHLVNTGLGNMIANELVNGPPVKMRMFGVRMPGKSGSSERLYEMQRLDVESVVRLTLEF